MDGLRISGGGVTGLVSELPAFNKLYIVYLNVQGSSRATGCRLPHPLVLAPAPPSLNHHHPAPRHLRSRRFLGRVHSHQGTRGQGQLNLSSWGLRSVQIHGHQVLRNHRRTRQTPRDADQLRPDHHHLIQTLPGSHHLQSLRNPTLHHLPRSQRNHSH